MDGVKIGGVYYGMDIQKAMEKAHVIVMDAAKKVFRDDNASIEMIRAGLDCYEVAFLERLKNDN